MRFLQSYQLLNWLGERGRACQPTAVKGWLSPSTLLRQSCSCLCYHTSYYRWAGPKLAADSSAFTSCLAVELPGLQLCSSTFGLKKKKRHGVQGSNSGFSGFWNKHLYPLSILAAPEIVVYIGCQATRWGSLPFNTHFDSDRQRAEIASSCMGTYVNCKET